MPTSRQATSDKEGFGFRPTKRTTSSEAGEQEEAKNIVAGCGYNLQCST